MPTDLINILFINTNMHTPFSQLKNVPMITVNLIITLIVVYRSRIMLRCNRIMQIKRFCPEITEILLSSTSISCYNHLVIPSFITQLRVLGPILQKTTLHINIVYARVQNVKYCVHLRVNNLLSSSNILTCLQRRPMNLKS